MITLIIPNLIKVFDFKKESFTKSIKEVQVSSKFLLVITELLKLVLSIFGGTYLPTFSVSFFLSTAQDERRIIMTQR